MIDARERPTAWTEPELRSTIRALDAEHVMQTYGRAARRVRPRRGHRAVRQRRARGTSTSSAASRSRRSATRTRRSPTRSPTRPARCCTSRTSTTTRSQPQVAATARRARSAAAARVFFANSGAEANECAIKLARRHGQTNGGPERFHVISARTARSTAARSRRSRPRASRRSRRPFQPLPTASATCRSPTSTRSRRRWTSACARCCSSRCRARAACKPSPPGYLEAVRALCDEREALLIMDEVQTGLGPHRRRWFGFQHSGVSARHRHDGEGARQRRARSARAGPAPTSPTAFRPGDHATTFGGQPLAASAALATLDVMEGERRARPARRGPEPASPRRWPQPSGSRTCAATGLLIAAELDPGIDAKAVADECLAAGARAQRSHADGAAPRAATARHRRRDRRSRRDPPCASSPHRGRRELRGADVSFLRRFLEVDDLTPAQFNGAARPRARVEARSRARSGGARRPCGRAAVREAVGAHPRLHRARGAHARRLPGRAARRGGRPRRTRESVDDVARTLAGYCSVIAARVYDHAALEEMTSRGRRADRQPAVRSARTPARRSPTSSPCVSTSASLEGRRVTYVGDGNNVAASLAFGAALAGVELTRRDAAGLRARRRRRGRVSATLVARSSCRTTRTKRSATPTAVYTDVWTSMGQEARDRGPQGRVRGLQVDAALMAAAGPGAVFLHCLPAHRGEEVAAEVIDGPASLVWAQAENRMHSVRSLLASLDTAPPVPGGRHRAQGAKAD